MNGPNNLIGWCDYTWNPVTGCKHGCEWCYARQISKRFGGDFKPKIHVNRLREPMIVKNPSRIFVCSMGELFGDWVPRNWIISIMDIIQKCPQHTFQLLTKNSMGLLPYRNDIPHNCWLGVTVTKYEDWCLRVPALSLITPHLRFVSFEPLLGKIKGTKEYWEPINWIIIGALTLPGGRTRQPEGEWVESLVSQADHYKIPVFMKENLEWENRRREFPEQKGTSSVARAIAGRRKLK